MGFGSGIRQVDRGNHAFSGTSGTDTLGTTLTDITKALLVFSWITDSTSTEGSIQYVNGVITNTTTLTFTRGKAGGSITVEWQVIEYY